MNRSDRKKRVKSSDCLRTLFTNIKKLNQKIKSHFSLQPMAKNILIGIFSFIITCFVYLLIQTKSPLSDVFTTERISMLKNRPANITRDIVVDMYFIPDNGGMVTLTRALIEDIAKKRPNWRLLIIIPKGGTRALNLLSRPNIKLIELEATISPLMFADQNFYLKSFDFIHDKLLQMLHYDRIFCDQDCDLIWDPLGESSYCNFLAVPRISTVHDLAYYDVPPEFFAKGSYRWKVNVCIKNTMHFSKKIITVSRFSQKRICDKFGVSKDFVKYIPIQLGTRVYSQGSPEKSAKVLDKYGLKSQKYFIFCSTWWRNKNHVALMKAFNKFAEKNSEIKLILVGTYRGKIEFSSIKDFCSDRLIITGFVPDEDLGILLKNALAFIHPSVYEGFGMPIIEAMANGIPVACSNVSSLPEVAGPAALLFDPFDVDSITQAMHRLANDPQLRKDLIQKGYQQAKKYSDRDAMVDEYIRVMEKVMRENDRRKAKIKNCN